MKDMIEIPRIVIDHWIEWLRPYRTEAIEGTGEHSENRGVIETIEQMEHILERSDAADSDGAK